MGCGASIRDVPLEEIFDRPVVIKHVNTPTEYLVAMEHGGRHVVSQCKGGSPQEDPRAHWIVRRRGEASFDGIEAYIVHEGNGEYLSAARADEIKLAKEDVKFVRHEGFISEGGTMLSEKMTVEQAKAKCASLPGCRGFTFNGPETDQPVMIDFKDKFDCKDQKDTGWTSYRCEESTDYGIAYTSKDFAQCVWFINAVAKKSIKQEPKPLGSTVRFIHTGRLVGEFLQPNDKRPSTDSPDGCRFIGTCACDPPYPLSEPSDMALYEILPIGPKVEETQPTKEEQPGKGQQPAEHQEIPFLGKKVIITHAGKFDGEYLYAAVGGDKEAGYRHIHTWTRGGSPKQDPQAHWMIQKLDGKLILQHSGSFRGEYIFATRNDDGNGRRPVYTNAYSGVNDRRGILPEDDASAHWKVIPCGSCYIIVHEASFEGEYLYAQDSDDGNGRRSVYTWTQGGRPEQDPQAYWQITPLV